MRRSRDARRGGTARVLLAVLAASTIANVASASADEQPSIVKAYGLDWIQRVRDDAWPQPKDQRPVICLLDTGVAITPDTPADDPNGPIVARLAIDGGDGLPQGTTFEHLHGTTMASVIAAPKNDWGTVGMFPQARIVSVRVTDGDATFITPPNMVKGIRACRTWATAQQVRLGVVVMAEARYDERATDSDWWSTASELVALGGGVFAAAAGNDPEAQVLPPATSAGVLTVSAGDDNGTLCWFANSEPAGGLRGPGCSSDSGAENAWPAGSSAATAVIGAAAAVVETLSPESSVGDVTQLLRSSAVGSVFSGGTLAARFAAAIVQLPVLGVSSTNSPASPTPTAPVGTAISISKGAASAAQPSDSLAEPPPARVVLWRPKVTVTRSGNRLRVRRRDHSGGILWVSAFGQGTFLRSMKGASASFAMKATVRRVKVWAGSADSATWRSLTSTVRVIGG